MFSFLCHGVFGRWHGRYLGLVGYFHSGQPVRERGMVSGTDIPDEEGKHCESDIVYTELAC